MPKIICIIPTLPNDISIKTLKSIYSQTVPVDYVYLLSKQIKESKPLPQKISSVLNDGLSGLNLNAFDYILRLDSDTVLPQDFIEKHIALHVDVCGGAGYAQLISVPFFQKNMNSLFNSLSDDSYNYYKAKSCGTALKLVTPVQYKEPGLFHNKFKYNFYSGELGFFIGYDPFQGVSYLRFKSKGIIYFLGYFWALLTFKKRFEFANTEQNKHLKKLFIKVKNKFV
jgi:hypothetical protein